MALRNMMWNNKSSVATVQSGFTLVELMIALVISGIILVAIYSAYYVQQRSYGAQNQVTEMQQNGRAATSIMIRELRMAGYDPDKIYGSNNNKLGILEANTTKVIFTMVADTDGYDNDNDGTTDEDGELKTIQYDLYDAYSDGDNDIGRQVGSAATSKRTIAENFDNLEFYYTLEDGTQTATPLAGDLRNIRAVQISILARADIQGRHFPKKTRTYTSASGVPWSYTDNYRRLLLTTTVQCRNMGLE